MIFIFLLLTIENIYIKWDFIEIEKYKVKLEAPKPGGS
jgi:hypothetical protein